METTKTLCRLICFIGLAHLLITGLSASAVPISFGETATGTISSLGQTVGYTFNATAGDTIYTRMETSWVNSPQIRLYAPNGTLIKATSGTISGHATDMTRTLPLTGKYTLLAGDSLGDDTGTFGLFLQRTNNPGRSQAVTFGATITDSITKQAEMKNYSFMATAGDTIYTRIETSWTNSPQIRLYAPNGLMVNTTTGTISDHATDITRTLPFTGKYTLLVGDNVGDDTGTFGLFLQRTNSSGHAQTIPFGVTVTDSITKQAEMKNYSFTASAGDTVYTRIQSSWTNSPQIRLYAPSGLLVNTTTGTISDHATDITRTLSSTGKYTLLVGDNVGDDTGTFGLFLQRTNNSGNTRTIPFGVTVTDSITKQAEMKNYSFTATAGDTVYTRIQSSWTNSPQIRLYAPSGLLVNTTTGTISDHATDITRTLPSTGKYTLLVGDNVGDDTGTFGLFLQRTNNPGNARTLSFGATVTDSVTQQAEMKNYSFTATAGRTIYTRMDTSWTNSPQLRLYAPNGVLVNTTTGSLGGRATAITSTLPFTGRYTLLAGDKIGDSTGTFGLSLQ